MNNSLADHIKVWEDFYNGLPEQSKLIVGNFQSINEFIEWASANNIVDPINLWQAREDSLIPAAAEPEGEEVETEGAQEHGNRPHRRHEAHIHPPDHKFFEEEAQKQAKKDAEKWEKKPNFTIAKTKEEAFRLSHEKTYDNLIKYYPRLAEDWVKNHNDEHVISALARKTQREESAARQKAAQSPTITRITWIPSFRRTAPTGPFITAGGSRRGRGFGGINNLAGRSINKRRAARRAAKAAKTAKAARAGLAAATGGTSAVVTTVVFNRKILWGLAIAGGLFLFFFVMIVFAAGCVIVDNPIGQAIGVDYCKGGGVVAAQPTPTQPPGQCAASANLPEVPACSTSDSSAIDSALATNFGISLVGDAADCDAKEIAFTTYSDLFQSSKYASLVKNAGTPRITMTNNACAGLTHDENFTIGACDNHSLPYFYAHEMGHVIENNNKSLEPAFDSALTSLIKSDSSCYEGQFLKTYLLRSGVNPQHESFAESIALYYLGGRKNVTFDPSKGYFGQDIPDFKSQCPSTYAWVKDNIFGGYEFDGSSTNECSVGATTDSCGGAYNISSNPTGQNFGDPKCELVSNGAENKQLIATELMSQLQTLNKTQDFCKWACIIHSESGFDPNSYNSHASRPQLGGWGLFQFLPYASYDTTKPYYYYRAGNISWRDQIARALHLQYNFLTPWQTGVKTNGYWSTYKSHCYLEPDWKPGGSCLPGTIGGVTTP